MDSSSSDRDPIETLAEEFLARRRRGERPTVEEYAARHPALAEAIRAVFPAMILVDELGAGAGAAPTGDRPATRVSESEQVGDYRIVREIGRGGMGVVYEAEQVSLGRRVALKLLSGATRPDSKQRGRFEREARAAARLHHTNIVPVFGTGEARRASPYYVMQFIQGHAGWTPLSMSCARHRPPAPGCWPTLRPPPARPCGRLSHDSAWRGAHR